MATQFSHFMKLPPEIRCLVYEHAIAHAYRRYIVIKSNKIKRDTRVVTSLAITQVNRLTRQESSPIFYRDKTITIYTCDRHDAAKATQWTKELIDSTVLESITSYIMRPLSRYLYRISMDLNDKEQPVKLLEDLSGYQNHRNLVASCVAEAQELVKKSKHRSNGRYVMSRELMQKVVEMMCRLGQDVDREEALRE